jgi:hypothetical protein
VKIDFDTDADESANFEDCPVQSGYMQGLRDNIGSRFTIVSCTCISLCNVEFSLISYFEIADLCGISG